MTRHLPLSELLSFVVDNRGRTCPVAECGIPLIATNCVKNSTLYPVLEKVRYVGTETYRNWFRAHPQPGDLIFVLKGSPGQVCVTPDPVNFCIAQDMVALRADPDIVYPAYLFAALRSPDVQFDISNLHVGSLIAHFKKGDFDRLEIPIPDMDLQKEIGDLYMYLSKKIELNRKMAATLEAMARALYRSWFVDFDPVHARSQGLPPAHMDEATAALFPDRFGEDGLPEGWEDIKASDAVSVVKGRSYKSKELAPSDTALITLKSFARGGGYRVDGLKPYTGTFKPEQVVSPGELILSMTDVTQAAEVIGRATLARSSRDFRQLVASLDVAILRPLISPAPSMEYLHQVFSSTEFIEHTHAHTTGTTVLHLSKEAVPSFIFALPPTRIVEAFQARAGDIRDRVLLLERENQTLATLRDTLLPKLMSGELRVGEALAQVEEAV